MKRRALVSFLKESLGGYPAALLVGPRQCGKTTLAKSLGGLYFDLEREEEQLRLDATWDETIRSKKRVILDEAQYYPIVFSRLRSEIDVNRKRMGKFLILGSISPDLMKQVGESLAGRMAICELTPFCVSELSKSFEFRNWIYGGFLDGGIESPKAYPHWQRNYLQLLAQRDLPTWGLPAKPAVTLKLFNPNAPLLSCQYPKTLSEKPQNLLA